MNKVVLTLLLHFILMFTLYQFQILVPLLFKYLLPSKVAVLLSTIFQPEIKAIEKQA